MESDLQQGTARCLRAIMAHLSLSRRAFAKMLGVKEAAVGNWIGRGASANLATQRSMIALCAHLPGLTIDYVYRGNVDGIPVYLASALRARQAKLLAY